MAQFVAWVTQIFKIFNVSQWQQKTYDNRVRQLMFLYFEFISYFVSMSYEK